MKDVLVSVIIPVYNTKFKSMRMCLNSLLNQTYKNFEAIIVDDGSTNKIKDVIDEFIVNNSNFKYFYKENSGVSNTRNYGIARSTGDYICFMDSDDEFDSHAIEKLVSLIESNNYDFVKTNFYFSSYNKKQEKLASSIFTGEVNNPDIKNKCLLSIIDGKMPTFIWTLILKRSFILNTNLFNESISFMEDKVFYYEIFSKSNNYLIDDTPTYYYYYDDFKNKDNSYWNKYLKNVNLVFDSILNIDKNNNANINYINNNAFLQINFVIYNLYKNDSKVNIKYKFNECNKQFISKIKVFKTNNVYSKICIFLINKKLFKLLKLMYKIKKWRCI